MFIFRNNRGKCHTFSSLANGGGWVRLASNRRIDATENVGGPASCGNAERLGPHQDLRPLATPTGVGVPFFREDVNPGTRETGHSAGGEAGAPGVTHARAAPTADTMHEGESRP